MYSGIKPQFKSDSTEYQGFSQDCILTHESWTTLRLLGLFWKISMKLRVDFKILGYNRFSLVSFSASGVAKESKNTLRYLLLQ